MTISPLDVFRIKIRFGQADYPRPGVIVALSQNSDVRLVVISSKLDLYRPSEHFLIRDDHSDFSATGLKFTSYVVGAPIFAIKSNELLTRMGSLQGELAQEFKNWMGM